MESMQTEAAAKLSARRYYVLGLLNRPDRGKPSMRAQGVGPLVVGMFNDALEGSYVAEAVRYFPFCRPLSPPPSARSCLSERPAPSGRTLPGRRPEPGTSPGRPVSAAGDETWESAE